MLTSLGVYASIPLGVGGFWVLQRFDLLAPVSYPVIVGLLAFAATANLAANAWLNAVPDSTLRLHARVAVSAITTTAVLYATGWGSILAIGYALGAAEMLEIAGARSWRPAIAWNLAAIGAGEMLLAFDVAPTMIEPRLAHFVAISGAACLVLVSRILGTTAERVERAEDELRESEEHFRSLVRHATDVIAEVDADGTIRYVSPAIEGLLGYEPTSLVGRSIDDVLATDPPQDAREVLGSIAGTPGRSVMIDMHLAHRSGEPRIAEATVTGRQTATGAGVVINLHDMTERRLLEERLVWDAGHDALTGLWNRAAFAAHLVQACERAARDQRAIALLFLDLDGFKQVNDSLGHDIGDAVLVEAAQRIVSAVRHCDTVGRLGGDEFTILLEQVDDDRDVVDVADRVVAAVAEPWLRFGTAVHVTASVGIATTGVGIASGEELMQQADAAMYAAKRSGRCRWERNPASTALG